MEIPRTATAIHNWQAWCPTFSLLQYEFKGRGEQLSVSYRASSFVCQLQGKVIPLFQYTSVKKNHGEDRELLELLLRNINCSYRIHLTYKHVLFLKPSGAHIPGIGSPRRLNFAPWRPIFVHPSCGIASRHASGAYNFEVAPGFLECLCTLF
jgi:hypothetical protein